MFLPTTKEEMQKFGWSQCDIILISGDSYIDSPYIGIAVIGNILYEAGFKVGIIAQPDVKTDLDITRLGEPKFFWGVSGGSVDSMVANYTATKKFRKSDDFTPGGINNKRPDRAVNVYVNTIRRYFKNTVPIVIGGIEASLRRIAHFDFWSNKVKKSILFDSKADILVYGMAEKSIIELANALKNNSDYKNIRGICYILKEPKNDYLQLPSFDEVVKDKDKFIDMFDIFYKNNDPISAKGLCQKHDTRYLIQNPPSQYLVEQELDKVYDLKYERAQHPYYEKMGKVKALETIKFSITTHQGCYGECNFCAIGVHQGRTIRSRSQNSIINEAKSFTKYKDFKGYINDVGGATANMYGYECTKKLKYGTCEDKRCMYPSMCKSMKVNHAPNIGLLQKINKIDGVKKAFVNSGIRYDTILADKKNGEKYLEQIVNHHVSGQMKIAPEHTEDKVLSLMGKPNKKTLIDFKRLFDKMNKKSGKKQFLTYYLIAAYPSCEEQDMQNLKNFSSNELKINPEQVQIYTPTPSTYSSVMYYTKKNPFTKEPIFVETDAAKKEKQKNIIIQKKGHRSYNRK
jgi:uncharacterized radical SAM protein YgiQ